RAGRAHAGAAGPGRPGAARRGPDHGRTVSPGARMRLLIWHLHGSWTTAFVQGGHTYLLPVSADRGPDGLGRARTWDWPPSAVVVNEPLRRGRYVGADLLPYFAQAAPLDVFGMGVRHLPARLGLPDLRAFEDLPQRQMHAALARRRVYLHPFRWTSLGLSLIEAMHLGMP